MRIEVSARLPASATLNLVPLPTTVLEFDQRSAEGTLCQESVEPAEVALEIKGRSIRREE